MFVWLFSLFAFVPLVLFFPSLHTDTLFWCGALLDIHLQLIHIRLIISLFCLYQYNYCTKAIAQCIASLGVMVVTALEAVAWFIRPKNANHLGSVELLGLKLSVSLFHSCSLSLSHYLSLSVCSHLLLVVPFLTLYSSSVSHLYSFLYHSGPGLMQTTCCLRPACRPDVKLSAKVGFEAHSKMNLHLSDQFTGSMSGLRQILTSTKDRTMLDSFKRDWKREKERRRERDKERERSESWINFPPWPQKDIMPLVDGIWNKCDVMLWCWSSNGRLVGKHATTYFNTSFTQTSLDFIPGFSPSSPTAAWPLCAQQVLLSMFCAVWKQSPHVEPCGMLTERNTVHEWWLLDSLPSSYMSDHKVFPHEVLWGRVKTLKQSEMWRLTCGSEKKLT